MSYSPATRPGAFLVRHRAGVTILEVLIAVGVATIGLFGVWALIPIAAQRVERGLLADAKSVFGQSAFNDFAIRGMGQPENWLDATGASIQDEATFPLSPHIPWSSYCLDPEFVIANGVAGNSFPAVATGATISMPRITLRNSSGGGPMLGQQAREIFRTRDDVDIHAGEDEDDPAEQHFLLANNTVTASRRYADQRLSWFATLTPAAYRHFSAASPPPNSGYDEYVLSLIVVNERDLTVPAVAVDASERISNVTNFYGGGIGGGDMQIQQTRHASDIDFKRGDWVMLSQEIPVAAGPPLQRHRWYRVVAADPNESTGFSDITLEGPDWDSLGGFATQCTYVPGVVAVYEKLIRLENTSMWK